MAHEDERADTGRDEVGTAHAGLGEDRPALGFGTRAIAAATRAPRVEQGTSAVPIYQSATFHARDVDDYAAIQLSKNIAQKIEDNLQYPGQIRVTVVRETRAVEYAK